MNKDSYMKVSVDYAIQWDEAVNRLYNTRWWLYQEHDIWLFDDTEGFTMEGFLIYPIGVSSSKAMEHGLDNYVYASLSTGIGKYTLEDIEDEIKRIKSYDEKCTKESTEKSWWEFWK